MKEVFPKERVLIGLDHLGCAMLLGVGLFSLLMYVLGIWKGVELIRNVLGY